MDSEPNPPPSRTLDKKCPRCGAALQQSDWEHEMPCAQCRNEPYWHDVLLPPISVYKPCPAEPRKVDAVTALYHKRLWAEGSRRWFMWYRV